MCENLVRIGWNRMYVNLEGGRSPLLGGGVTCDLRFPSSNLAELFQSKVICENLVRIGWAFQELSCPQTNKQTYKHTNKHPPPPKKKSQTQLKTISFGKKFPGGYKYVYETLPRRQLYDLKILEWKAESLCFWRSRIKAQGQWPSNIVAYKDESFRV